MTAEIGLMKATEQLAAMEMMAVDPIARVVAPRFWAGVISMPLLAAMFSAMGIFGGYLVGVVLIGVDEGSFWSQMQAAVDFQEDIVNGVIKSFVFGVAVTWIALFEGLRCAADGRRRVGGDDAHGRHFFARDPGSGLPAHRIHVSGDLMERSTLDLWVGLFVCAGIGALLVLAMKVGNMGEHRHRRRDLYVLREFRQYRRA